MQLKEGMKVRVKTRKEAIATYGTCDSWEIDMPFGYVPDTMNNWLNKIVTINTITGDNVRLEEVRYSWHKNMFKSRILLSFKNLQEN